WIAGTGVFAAHLHHRGSDRKRSRQSPDGPHRRWSIGGDHVADGRHRRHTRFRQGRGHTVLAGHGQDQRPGEDSTGYQRPDDLSGTAWDRASAPIKRMPSDAIPTSPTEAPPKALFGELGRDPELLGDFILESREHLTAIELHLLALDQDAGNSE